MSAITAFGFNTQNTIADSQLSSAVKTNNNTVKKTNLLVVLSWIPVLALIPAFFHGKAALSKDNGGIKENKALFGRAVAEALCLGPILMLVDAAVTGKRFGSMPSCKRTTNI